MKRTTKDLKFTTPFIGTREERQKRRDSMMEEHELNGSIRGLQTQVKQASLNALDGGDMESVYSPLHYKTI